LRRSLPFCIALVVLSAGCAGGGAGPASGIPPAPKPATQTAARSHGGPLLTIRTGALGATVSRLVLGANMATWYDVTKPQVAPAFRTAGMTATRWPGGSESDDYHWKTNSLGTGKCAGGYVYPPSSFDHFMNDVAKPAKLDVAITVNYGSNPDCTDGADPSEAAAWVAYANATKNYGITWWTVGNEMFGASWETDRHSKPHDPAQYASLVATQFYPKMKAASKTPIDVCVDVEPGWYTGWDPVVLAHAKYDCVELHYYAQGSTISDSYLIDKGAADLTAGIDALKGELKAAGRAGTPIYVGELGSTVGVPGKQTTSITQALYAGQVIGELLQDGVARATWWLGFGGCNPQSDGGDFDASLYGWQKYGGYMLFSDGVTPYECTGTDAPAAGTPLPTARAFQVASHFVRGGERTIGTTLQQLPDVRAYATTYAGGYAIMLFNTNETSAATVPVKISGRASGPGGTIFTYDKALYDLSKRNVWKGPATTTLAAWKGTFSLNLPPWSMTVVQIR
jgi:hypothetical protein